MGRPILLDGFSGAGGAGVGYWRAGFKVVSNDIFPMPRNPFPFVQEDALELLTWLIKSKNIRQFSALHMSPPCQGYSKMVNCRPGLAAEYPKLIEPVRELLEATGLPYVIENVEGAPLRPDAVLCGQMFGLELYRHRVFESNVPLVQPEHPPHLIPASKAGHWVPGTIMSVAGHVSPIAKAREVMGIDWMTRDELGESIPPVFAEHIGKSLLRAL